MPVSGPSTPPADSVATTTIQDDAVTAAKIATGQVADDEIASTAVVAASYTNADITVDEDGRITAAANGSAGGSAQTIEHGHAGAAWLVSNTTLTSDPTDAVRPVVSFADGVTAIAAFELSTPAGATAISSIRVLYENRGATSARNIRLQVFVSSIDISDLPEAVNLDANDVVSQYAAHTVVGEAAAVTIDAEAFNAIGTIAEGDKLIVYIRREGADGADTYNIAWDVYGVEITFS